MPIISYPIAITARRRFSHLFNMKNNSSPPPTNLRKKKYLSLPKDKPKRLKQSLRGREIPKLLKNRLLRRLLAPRPGLPNSLYLKSPPPQKIEDLIVILRQKQTLIQDQAPKCQNLS
jgi:hypothetical protein